MSNEVILTTTSSSCKAIGSNGFKLVSVVLSFFNEQENLSELIQRLRSVFHNLIQNNIVQQYELLFVDDCSTDNSFQILIDHSHQSPSCEKLRVLRMSRNFGVSACVFAGFQHSQGDVVVYMDSDLQDPPEVIPQMIYAMLARPGIEVVHTIRTCREGESFIKLLFTRIGYYVLKKSSSIDLPIEAGDFKLLSKRVVHELLRCNEVNPYIRGLVSWVGFSQVKIPYNREKRFSGKTKFPIFSSKVISNFFSSALIAFSDIPLTILSITGLFISCLAFVIETYLIWQYIVSGIAKTEVLAIATFSLLAGIQLIGIGVLGLYIGPILKESRNRPRYVINSTYGLSSTEPALDSQR
jgi:dolichol-phosphate mannosyltransferase